MPAKAVLELPPLKPGMNRCGGKGGQVQSLSKQEKQDAVGPDVCIMLQPQNTQHFLQFISSNANNE